MKKKSEKSEIDQIMRVLQGKMPKVTISHQSVEKKEEATKSQQQKSHPERSWFYRGKMSGSH